EGGGTQPFSSINTGTLCVVSEQSALPAANTGYSYGTPTVQISGATGAACAATPAGALACQQFTMPAGGIVTATVTNTLQADPASITVTKTVTGNLAGLVAGSTFPITIDCNLDQNFQGGTTSGTPQNGGSVSLNSAL